MRARGKTGVTYLHVESWKIISAIHDTLNLCLINLNARNVRSTLFQSSRHQIIDHRFVTHIRVGIYCDMQWEKNSRKSWSAVFMNVHQSQPKRLEQAWNDKSKSHNNITEIQSLERMLPHVYAIVKLSIDPSVWHRVARRTISHTLLLRVSVWSPLYFSYAFFRSDHLR